MASEQSPSVLYAPQWHALYKHHWGGRQSVREEERPERLGPRGSTSITSKKLSYLFYGLQTSCPVISNKERRTPLSDSVRSLNCTASVRAETWIRVCSVLSIVLAEGWTRQGSTKTQLGERGNTEFIQKASLIWALFFFFFLKEHESIFSSTWKFSTWRVQAIDLLTDWLLLTLLVLLRENMRKIYICVCSEHMPYTKMFYHYDLVQLH